MEAVDYLKMMTSDVSSREWEKFKRKNRLLYAFHQENYSASESLDDEKELVRIEIIYINGREDEYEESDSQDSQSDGVGNKIKREKIPSGRGKKMSRKRTGFNLESVGNKIEREKIPSGRGNKMSRKRTGINLESVANKLQRKKIPSGRSKKMSRKRSGINLESDAKHAWINHTEGPLSENATLTSPASCEEVRQPNVIENQVPSTIQMGGNPDEDDAMSLKSEDLNLDLGDLSPEIELYQQAGVSVEEIIEMGPHPREVSGTTESAQQILQEL